MSVSHVKVYCKSSSLEIKPQEKSRGIKIADSVHTPKRKQAFQQKGAVNRKQIRLRFAVILLMVLMATAWWQGSQASSPDEGGSGNMAQYDLTQLWKLSDSFIAGGASAADWSLRWQFQSNDSEAKNKLIAALFPDEKSRSIPKRVTNSGKTMTAYVTGLGQVSLHQDSEQAIQHGEATAQFVINWTSANAKAPLTELDLNNAAKKLEKIIETFSASADFSVKLQGKATKAAGQGNWEKLTSNAERVEYYDEGGSKSALYYTTQFQQYNWMPGGYKANLQIALHPLSNSEDKLLTIGLPVLTGEF